MRHLEIVQNATDEMRGFSVDDIQIASPCHASWDDMHGDERVRFCGSCRKNVYTLDGMTRREIAALFEETEGRACVRLYRRADGTVLTADCPVGLAEKARRMARRAYAMSLVLVVTLVSGIAALLLGGSRRCDLPSTGRAVASDAAMHTMGAPVPERTMGEPMPLPPVPTTPGGVPRVMGKVKLPVIDDVAPSPAPH